MLIEDESDSIDAMHTFYHCVAAISAIDLAASLPHAHTRSSASIYSSRTLVTMISIRSILSRSSRVTTSSLFIASRTMSSTSSTSSSSSSSFVSPIVASLKDPSLFKSECYINGAWTSSSTGRTISVSSPTTGAIIGTIPHLSRSDTESAIAAAAAAFPRWSAMTARARGDILMKWHDLCMTHKIDLGTILSMEQGKPLGEAVGEVAYGAGFFQVYAGEAERINGEILQPSNTSTRVMTFKQPVGVVAAITPWNFPNAMITRKCGAALAAGCTVVLKPSEFTPYSAFALAELAHRAGLPAGCFNLVTGDAADIGQSMTQSTIVKKLTFTGSTRVGKLLLKQCADTVKRTSMELGGNAPFIVFNDADIDAAVAGLILCKYRNTGQTCVTANRIFVQSGIYDEFASKLAAKVATLVQGSGLSSGVNIGPLINEAAMTKVATQVADAVAHGGKVICGGAPTTSGLVGTTGSSLFYQPTIVTNANNRMMVAQEETFGPVAFLFKFESEAEVIAEANNVDAGLAAYFFTNDAKRIWRMSEALQYGMVGANTGSVSSTTAPFGGMKQSGFGREGSHHGVTDYLDIKAVHVGI